MFKMDAEEFKRLIHERDFTSDEVIAFTDIEPATFRNWLKRDVVAIGEKHRLGRWLFSPIDMVKVSTMVDLGEFGVAPASAASLCDMVANLLIEFADNTIAWRASPEYDGRSSLPFPLRNYVIVAVPTDDGFRHRGAVWVGNELVFNHKDDALNEAAQSIRRVTHLQIAAGLIIEDIMEKVKNALDKRGQEGL